jgi:hypothetical protein
MTQFEIARPDLVAKAAAAATELEGQTSIDDASQLENETTTDLDAEAPATCEAHGYTHKFTSCEDAAAPTKDEKPVYEYDWQNPEPRRTAAPLVDVEDDVDRVESGELDTEGATIDWTGLGAPRCLYCGKTHHYDGKGKNLYFWIYPGCTPTHRDRSQHKTN